MLLVVILCSLLLTGILVSAVFVELQANKSEIAITQLMVDALELELRRIDAVQRLQSERERKSRQQPVDPRAIQVPIPSGSAESTGTPERIITKQQPVSSTEGEKFFVIVESTSSKTEAIARARSLETRGYSGEVVKTATGFFGIALGRFDFDEAKIAKENAINDKLGTGRPYLINANRVVQYVYPETSGD